MQKKIIALAIASALISPVAMAADVTVTGGMQAEVVSIGGDAYAPAAGAVPARSVNGLYVADGWENGLEDAGSYGFLKFSATEDLGDGMKALAVFNLQTNPGDAGKGNLGTREAYVGLSGGFGTALVGSMNTPYKSSTTSYDPFIATSFQARSNNGMSGLMNGYASNAIAYANNFMDGQIKLVAALVIDETADVAAGSDKTYGHHGKSFSLAFAPVDNAEVSIAYIDVTDMGGATDSSPNAKATKIAAKYKMDALTVAAQVEMLDTGITGSADKGNVMFLTASYAMDTANTISASYGSTDKKVTGNLNNDTYMALGLNHAFSKKTSGMLAYRSSKWNDVASESAIGATLRVNF